MKKLLHNIRLLLLLVLMAVGVQSCTRDLHEMDAVQVNFTATFSGDNLTRSFGSAEHINTLVVGVFDAQQNELYRKSFPADGILTDVSLSLAKNQTYNFVFWAYSKTENESYNINDLKAIKMEEIEGPITFSQAEDMDAFFATAEEITITGSSSYPVELVRPLAQINVGTSGIPVLTTFTTKTTPDTFHPFTNTVSGKADFTWEFNETTAEKFTADGTEYNYLAMTYVFAPADIAGTISADLTMIEGATSHRVEFSEMKIKANNRINIAGNFTAK